MINVLWPELPPSKFIDELNKDLAKIPENAEIVLLGDFNVDYKQRSTDRSRMQTLARAHSIEQIVTSPTRITEKTQSMMDLIFVNNNPRVVSSEVFPLSISDHSLIQYTAQLKLDFLNLADVTETLVATNVTMKASLKII